MQIYSKAEVDKISCRIIGAAIEVHKNVGPGLLESAYHKFMKHELTLAGLCHASEFLVPVKYKGLVIETELRCDFLVENCVVVELKAVERLAPIFDAQLLTYMRFLEKPKGILINFTCTNLFSQGQKTLVNELYQALP